jgi:hypothetical protein
LLPKKVNINIYRTVILTVVGCDAWAAILRKGHRFESRVLTKILGLKMEQQSGGNCILRNCAANRYLDD